MDKSRIEQKALNNNFQLFTGLSLVFGLSVFFLFIGFISFEMTHQKPNPKLARGKSKPYASSSSGSSNQSSPYRNLWKAPSTNELPNDPNSELVRYGKELIVHTAKYLGPKGSIAQISNGLNCQNCHLEAGTTPFGNNYGGVFSTYPKVRPRSEKMVDIPQRINSCFQRSLNGQTLALESKEMKAILAYIEWLGKEVPKGEKPEGAGLIPLAYLDRAADPKKGHSIYDAECARCHGNDGEGKLFSDGVSYEYPPLWGPHAYNVSAGLFRLEKFARFVKANMPYGVTYSSPTLSDEEAWDLAAFVNSQPHPNKRFEGDWPNLLAKYTSSEPSGERSH